MSRFFVSDVCDTLYAANTTAEFVDFLTQRWGGPLRRSVATGVLTRGHPLHLASALAFKGPGLDFGRALLIGCLRGERKPALRRLAEHFVDEVLEARRNEKAWSELEAARSRGETLILASASIDVVIEAVARRADAEWFASRLEWDARGVATGRLSEDLTGRKVGALAQILRPAEHVTVMTDNATDRELLEQADRRIVVIAREGDRRRWTGLVAEFLQP